MIRRWFSSSGSPALWFAAAALFAVVTVAFAVAAHTHGWDRRDAGHVGIAGGITLACIAIGIDRIVRRRGSQRS